jgi:hypothetical protein
LRSAGEGEIDEQVAWRDAGAAQTRRRLTNEMFFPPRVGGADLVAVKVCALAESFLTEPGGLASAADGVAEDLQNVALSSLDCTL